MKSKRLKLGQIDLQMCKDFDIIQRCWIRRPTAIIVFQKPLSVCWGLFLVPILVPKIHDYVIFGVLFLIKNIDLLRILRVLKNTF